MDQPNPMRQRVVVFLVCLAAALAGGGDLRAQDYVAPSGGGSFFSRDLGTAMRVDYNSQYYGTEEGVVAIGGMKVFSQEGSTWLLDAQGTLSDEFGGGFNAGVGYRQLTDTFWGYDSQRIRGVSFWTDGQSTTNDNWFTQLGITVESLGDKWDARLSTYLPLEREKAAGDTIVGMLDDPFYEGHQLVGGTEITPIDTALTVVDAEFAHRLLDLEAWAFAGYYHLGGGGYDEDGYRVGFRGYAVPDIQVSVQVSDDDLYGTNVSAGLTWFVGRTHKCNQPVGTIYDRFREPVLRNDFIATTQRFETAGVNALTDNSTDEEFYFVHVDANASGGGDGSYENPYNTLDLAEANSDENDIVLVWSGSAAAPTFTPAGTLTIQEGQRWLGEGLDLDGEAVLHYVNTAEVGLISLPETSDGSSEGFRASITGLAGSDVFTLGADATNAEINNFDVDGGATAINATDLNGFVGSNLGLTNQTGDAVVLTDVSGTNIIDNSVVISGAGGRGIVISGGTGTLGATATVESSDGLAVDIDGWTGGSVTLGQIGEADDDGNPTTAHTGGVRVVNSEAGTINFSGLANIDTSATDSLNAVYLENNDGATILFSELFATDDDDHTVLIDGGGTVQFYNTDDTSSITSTGSGDAVHITEANTTDSSDDPVVSVASAVTNSGTGRAVYVENIDSTGGIAFSGAITDTSGNGSGIELVNNGLYDATSISFTGETTLSTGANSAVTLTDNDDATISFSDLKATAEDGDTFVVQGGGTVTVSENDDEDTYINNTGAGDAVRIEGIAAGHAADPTVTIESAITNTDSATGGHVVVVDGVGDESLGITFSGDVTDDGTNGEGILVQDSSAVTVEFTGTTSLSTGANSAVVLSNNEDATDGAATIRFDDLNATSSSVNGTFLVEGGGTVTVSDTENASVITNSSSGAAVYIDGDNGAGVTGDSTVTIAADIKNSSTGRAVIVEDRTDNNVTFTGDVGNGSGTDGGILVQNVNGGIVGFSESVTVNTSNHTGIELIDNTDGTITFNGMDVTTTNQTGFSATGGGTLAASNSVNPNAIDATTGTGVIIDGMTIDAANVAFDTVNVAGSPTNGVVLTDNEGGSITIGSDTNDPGTLTTTGDTIVIDGGDNDITVNTDAASSTGQALVVQNRTGGSTTINGDLTATSGSDSGVLIDNNTGGTIDVTGDMALNSGGAIAAQISGNDGASVIFSGDTINLNGSVGTGIDISGTNTSVLVSADVTNSGATAVRIGGNATAATISGNISDDSATLLEVNGLTGGTVNVSGNLTRTGSGSQGILVTNNTGGTLNVTGDVTLNTGTSTGVEFSGNSGTFAGNIDGSGSNNLAVTTTTGSGIVVSGGGAITIDSGTTANSVTMTGTNANGAIDIDDATDLTINNTTVDVQAAADGTDTPGISILHTINTVGQIELNDVTVTAADGRGVDVVANGTGRFDLVMDNVEIDVSTQVGTDHVGFSLDTGANTNRVDLTMTNSTITANDASAFRATLDDASGDVRFLITSDIGGDGQLFSNNSADTTFDVVVDDAMSFSAQIGTTTTVDVDDPEATPATFLSNRFNNSGGGDQFAVDLVSGSVDLDLRGNTAQGGTGVFRLTENGDPFRLVDRNDTVGSPSTNNSGNVVDTNGNIINRSPGVPIP